MVGHISGSQHEAVPEVILDRQEDAESRPLLGVVRVTLRGSAVRGAGKAGRREVTSDSVDLEVARLAVPTWRVVEWRNTQFDAEDILRAAARPLRLMGDQDSVVEALTMPGHALAEQPAVAEELAGAVVARLGSFAGAQTAEGSVRDGRVNFELAYGLPKDSVPVLRVMYGLAWDTQADLTDEF